MTRIHSDSIVQVFRRGAIRLLLLCWLSHFSPSLRAACFTDPMMQGQDPTVVFQDGYFHMVQSDGCNVRLRRAASLGGLVTAANSIIYSPGCSELWAPEIHWISNRWYIYYTLNTNLNTGGIDRRGFVAESQGASPFGPYTNRGVLFRNYWNIDGNVFQWAGRLYYLFSGEPVGGAQNIYIAPMSNPYTLSGTPVMISAPVQPWERVGTPKVNEGPWGFTHGGVLYVVYSASGCWTDNYTLGLLTLTGTDPVDPGSWTKSGPVFAQTPGAYGPGHNSLVTDPMGQWWNFYHANNNPGEGCGNLRRIRAQRLFWQSNGSPDFGSPVPNGSIISDSPDFGVVHFPLLETGGVTAASTICQRTATLIGGTSWANPGLHFNGTNSYLNCLPGLGNDVQHQLTLSAWVRPEAFSDWAGIITKGTNSSPYALQLWNDGAIRFTVNWGSPTGGIGGGSWNSVRKLSLGQWQHIAVTYDGDRIRFYLNGSVDSYQPQVALRFGVAYEPLILGADLPGGDEFFRGAIRSARVYGRPLAQAEFFTVENFPPSLGPLADTNLVAGQDFAFQINATDPNLPAQALTFQLLSAPVGATIDPALGRFNWRPALSQAPSTNAISVAVADHGSPNLSATQTFTVTVRSPVPPILAAPAIHNGALQFEVTGDPGPDYAVLGSSNLLSWEQLFITNLPTSPFRISIPSASPQYFYRLQLR